MQEIPVYYVKPFIFTKDKAWCEIFMNTIEKMGGHMKAGTLVCLPEDAVLVFPPKIEEAPKS